MKFPVTKLLLAAGVAATLGACSALGGSSHEPFLVLGQIHQGQTQDEVRSIAGTPAYVGSNPRTNETLWTYSFTDEWGYPSEFGVDFDNATGVVAETSTQRIGND